MMKTIIKCCIVALFLLGLPSISFAEVYQVKEVLSVYDGDTFTVMIEFVQFDIFVKAKVRLNGVNCPEIRTKDKEEKALGLVAKRFTEDFLSQGDVSIDIKKREKFGRFLSDAFCNGKSLSEELIKAKLGKAYYGGKRNGWFK